MTEVAARAVQLTKIYGEGETRVTALDKIDVEIPAHELTAVMGPSGSGKSTLLHCLAGLDTPTSGEVWVEDRSLQGMNDDQLTQLRRDHIGFVFQTFNLIPTLNTLENIALPARIASRRPDVDLLNTLMTTLALTGRAGHLPHQMSIGQQQRVALARALITKPSVVFADEPTGNLDTNNSAELMIFLRRSVDDLGQTIAMVTHDPAAASYADQVLFLTDGKLVDTLQAPTPERVLMSMARIDGKGR
ncbi:ABC transporter ATP-binding protein [Nonomuraea sp. NPDC059007]|uniref:ABC transporter ATP-binding protein n=1 Tax=Nonomuraea sp. NPDC059007 TaxID=3346692 RepID=UPI0036ACF874